MMKSERLQTGILVFNYDSSSNTLSPTYVFSSPIVPSGYCYLPNWVQCHFSYRRKSPGTCFSLSGRPGTTTVLCILPVAASRVRTALYVTCEIHGHMYCLKPGENGCILCNNEYVHVLKTEPQQFCAYQERRLPPTEGNHGIKHPKS